MLLRATSSCRVAQVPSAPMAADRQEIERLLGRPVASAERATWGFTNRTDLVTLRDGSRLVFQRFRRRSAAHHRLRVTEALVAPARAAGVPVAEVLAVGIEAEP